ncbi:MAG: hypothetical protein JXN65_01330 [Clostridia bacterium]|nr:hypothetical protein [Clostridia bacterium]
MNMKCYKFKDGRRLFKLLYMILALNSVAYILKIITMPEEKNFAIFSTIAMVVIGIIIYFSTNEDVYIGKSELKVKKQVPFMMVTRVRASTGIIIEHGSKVEIIKALDLEKNYEKYAELLDEILDKISKQARDKSKSSKELLDEVIAKRASRYKKTDKKGKPELGGILRFLYVIAYLACFPLVLFIISNIAGTAAEVYPDISYLPQAVLGPLAAIAAIILFVLRKRSVRYALAAAPLASMLSVIITYVFSFNTFGAGQPLVYATISLVLTCAVSVFLSISFVEYINNFDRPKQTLN